MIKQLMEQFIQGSISIPDYLKAIVPLRQQDIQDIYSYNDTTHLDEMMHAYILLWSLKYNYIDLTYPKEHIYLSYLSSLLEDESIKHVSFLDIQFSSAIVEIFTTQGNIYFFINHSLKETILNVPKEIQYQTVYCLNCNDDMTLGTHLDMPEFSFYAFKK
ncbi:MAG: hypothetical protein NC182_06305 [Prevotella sp.]|nr:hypothetical protein [Staphylococcus sp.]MCM1350797.1 hypothetical protein [Prevotella sp.]